MKSKISYIILFCFVFIFINACDQYKEENTSIERIIQDNRLKIQNDKKNVVLVVPVAGCSVCIEQAKDFISQISDSNFFVIISCYSTRDFRLNFSGKDLENKKYIIDATGQAFRYKLVDVGCKLYFLENKKIKSVKKISCTESNLLKQTIDYLK